jgi:hypothetical protein
MIFNKGEISNTTIQARKINEAYTYLKMMHGISLAQDQMKNNNKPFK